MAQPEKVAILPFEIHSEKDIDYIQAGIFEMLSSRLSLKDRVMVAHQKDISRTVFNNQLMSDPEFFRTVGKNLDSDYLLTGSITEFSDAFSLDTTILNMKNGHSRSFFAQADSIEKIIPELNTLVAKINKEIFHRNSLSSLEIASKKNLSAQESIRANPETLIPRDFFENNPQKKPFWKFWATEKEPHKEETFEVEAPSEPHVQLDPTINDIMEETDEEPRNHPFWMFWKKDETIQ